MKNIHIVMLVLLVTVASLMAQSSSQGHKDHAPKHQGQFFMAPDGYHHLEGSMPHSKEFRIYFYDNHSKPVSALPFQTKTSVSVDRMIKGREVGKPVKLKVEAGEKEKFLVVKLPLNYQLPLYYTVEIKFPKRTETDLFNFTFEAPAKKDS